MAHLLNLRLLADASLDDYALLGFEGREAISEPFEYRLELVTGVRDDLTGWIGKACEFDVSPDGGEERLFAGRIYAARRVESPGAPRVFITVRPAYFALGYGRATHFIQDKTSLDIFEAMTKDVGGLVKTVSVSPPPPARGYSVRYDESEIDYLARLLARDGVIYFFRYERGAGTYRHRMVLTNRVADYVDLPGATATFAYPTSTMIGELSRGYRATARRHGLGSFNPNKLDQPFRKDGVSGEAWGAVYGHDHHSLGFEAAAQGGADLAYTVQEEGHAQLADQLEGMSQEPCFTAGGRVEIVEDPTEGPPIAPRRVVLTAVTHSARDPWMLGGGEPADYSNRFVAIDATKVYRPPVDRPERRAPGPVIGTVQDEASAAGEAKIDDQWRVPVMVAQARDYSAQGLPKFVWLPVQQQWAHSTHGAQFFPRIGARVVIDFLYGNPDLPFITGTVYSPSQPYPFDPASKATQSGWRSVSDKNGSVTQEFRFEDKPGSEEVYLYTGRDYRRLIDQDDFGTVKRDQTLAVERDQSLAVTRHRTVKIDGKQTTDVKETRTVTVQQKDLLESKREVEIKVGPCSITLTMSGIEIKAPKITIKADATLDASAGGTASLKSPKTDVAGDGMLTLKGGVVMIN